MDDDVAEFLKDGETVRECILRNRADIDSLMVLYGQTLKARAEAESALAAAREEIEHWITRYNELEAWRAQTSKLHLEAEAKVARLQQVKETALSLAAFATNGWACYARIDAEHVEIARLHAERRKIEAHP